MDDLRASTKRAKELGATMTTENIPVANNGEFTIKDPTGAIVAMWPSVDRNSNSSSDRQRARILLTEFAVYS